MSFSVTCSNCDRRFVDIDESLIGQSARCRCGSIVELDPVWDFKKNETNRRPKNRKRPVASAKAAESKPAKERPTQSSKRRPKAALNKTPEADTNRPNVRRAKRHSKKTEVAAAQASVPAASSDSNTVPDDSIQTKSKSTDDALFDSYADLDQILAAGADHTPLESTRVDSPFVEPEEKINQPNRRGIVGASIGGFAGLLAAFVLLVTRTSAFAGTPFGWTGSTFYGSYTASYGSGEMTNSITNLFIGVGWWILLLAVLMGIASILLLIRVAIRISADRQALAWSRGLLATTGVVCLFSLMGLLFVQTIHHGNLIRDLDSFSNSDPIEGLIEPIDKADTFQDVREKYESENTDFLIGVLTFAVLPLISFAGVATSLLFDER